MFGAFPKWANPEVLGALVALTLSNSRIYRIVQEALTKVVKHAQATQVSVVIERLADQALAIIEDNGQGFDVERALSQPDGEQALGILDMRERGALVGGTLEIESTPGSGTSVFARIPLKHEA